MSKPRIALPVAGRGMRCNCQLHLLHLWFQRQIKPVLARVDYRRMRQVLRDCLVVAGRCLLLIGCVQNGRRGAGREGFGDWRRVQLLLCAAVLPVLLAFDHHSPLRLRAHTPSHPSIHHDAAYVRAACSCAEHGAALASMLIQRSPFPAVNNGKTTISTSIS